MVLMVTFWDVNVSLILKTKKLIVPFWKIKHLLRQVLFYCLNHIKMLIKSKMNNNY